MAIAKGTATGIRLTQVTFFDVVDLVEVTISLVFSSGLELDSQAARSMPSSSPKIGTS